MNHNKDLGDNEATLNQRNFLDEFAYDLEIPSDSLRTLFERYRQMAVISIAEGYCDYDAEGAELEYDDYSEEDDEPRPWSVPWAMAKLKEIPKEKRWAIENQLDRINHGEMDRGIFRVASHNHTIEEALGRGTIVEDYLKILDSYYLEDFPDCNIEVVARMDTMAGGYSIDGGLSRLLYRSREHPNRAWNDLRAVINSPSALVVGGNGLISTIMYNFANQLERDPGIVDQLTTGLETDELIGNIATLAEVTKFLHGTWEWGVSPEVIVRKIDELSMAEDVNPLVHIVSRAAIEGIREAQGDIYEGTSLYNYKNTSSYGTFLPRDEVIDQSYNTSSSVLNKIESVSSEVLSTVIGPAGRLMGFLDPNAKARFYSLEEFDALMESHNITWQGSPGEMVTFCSNYFVPQVYDAVRQDIGIDFKRISLSGNVNFAAYLSRQKDLVQYGRLKSAINGLSDDERVPFIEAFLATEFGDDYGEAILGIMESPKISTEQKADILNKLANIRSNIHLFTDKIAEIAGDDFAGDASSLFANRVTDTLYGIKHYIDHDGATQRIQMGSMEASVDMTEDAMVKGMDYLDQSLASLAKMKVGATHSKADDKSSNIEFGYVAGTGDRVLMMTKPIYGQANDTMVRGKKARINYMIGVDGQLPSIDMQERDKHAVSVRLDLDSDGVLRLDIGGRPLAYTEGAAYTGKDTPDFTVAKLISLGNWYRSHQIGSKPSDYHVDLRVMTPEVFAVAADKIRMGTEYSPTPLRIVQKQGGVAVESTLRMVA